MFLRGSVDGLIDLLISLSATLSPIGLTGPVGGGGPETTGAGCETSGALSTAAVSLPPALLARRRPSHKPPAKSRMTSVAAMANAGEKRGRNRLREVVGKGCGS